MAKQSKPQMTQQRRMDIFSKEILNVFDIMEIFEISKSEAYDKIREIRATSDRLKSNGICHVQDYIEHFNLPVDRYIVTVVAERERDNKLQFYRTAKAE